MPTYEYECKNCGHTFEAFQAMSEAPLKVCPECGKEVRRLIFGGTGVIFKGSGFYVTDKSKSSAGGAAAKKTKPAGESGPGAEQKTASGGADSGDSGSKAAQKSGSAGTTEKAKTA
jgi:putative FmdB family regulatory protein